MTYVQAPSDEAPPARRGNVGLGDYGWWVRTTVAGAGVVPEGHEVLTRSAAAGLAISPTELGFLIEGVRRPDEASLVAHILPGEQKRHFLRATVLQGTAAAWTAATNHLRDLHRRIRAFGAGRAPEQLRLIGEALHLIQDSFAPAHVVRDPGSGRILFIKNFGPTTSGPINHGFPVDLRDRIHSGIIRPTLRPEATRAIGASRDYLAMTLRHIGGGVPVPVIDTELNAFVGRHMPL
jgi:hypothetical protein